MNNTKIWTSLDDTKELREMILNNPELPILFFVGEESYSGEYPRNMAELHSFKIKEVGYDGEWYIGKDDWRDKLFDKYCDDYETEEELEKYVDKCMDNTEFIKAIVIYAG